MANPNPSPASRFQVGASGNPNGRPKKVLARVDEVLKEAGIHPARELLKLYEESPDRRDRIKIMLELLSYVQPKPREMTPLDEEIEAAKLKLMSSAELLKAAREKLSEIEQKEAG